MDDFPYGAAVKFGWQKTKENFWNLMAVISIFIVIVGTFNYFTNNFEKTMPLVSLIVQICSIAINIIMFLGIIRIGLKVYAGEKFNVFEMFNSWGLFFKYFLGSILYFLSVLVGLCLLIVPGIILAVRMSFWAYLIVDKQLGPLEALKESMRLTKGSAVNLCLFGFVSLGLLLLGFLALIVGLIVAIPVAQISYIFIYRYLESKHQPAVA